MMKRKGPRKILKTKKQWQRTIRQRRWKQPPRWKRLTTKKKLNRRKRQIPREMIKIQETGSAAEGATKEERSPRKKAVRASVEWSNVKLEEPRKRRPTERYGIDVIMNVTEEQAETEN